MGGPQLSWRDAAEQEYFAIVAWYAEASGPTLASRFVDAVDETSALILAYPHAGSQRFDISPQGSTLLFRRTGRFPYLLFYLLHEDRIEIVRLLHERRDIPQILI